MAEPEPDCSALLDEELSSFVFNYLSDSQYEVSGEEHLYSDFPEIDLSPLDTSDFDSANCFSEFQWWCEHSETESSQYSTDDSELFQQIIDSENEALLAALTETLDDIQEEDMGLAAFKNMDEGDMPNSGYTSPIPSPNPAAPVTRGPPVAQEVDELSLLKKLLLSPSNVPPSYEVQREGNIWRQGPPKSRPQRSCAKVEGVHDRKSTFPQAQSRNCTELHKHLTTTTTTRHCPHRKNSGPLDKCHADNINTCSLPQRHYIQNEEDSNLNKDASNCGNSVAPPLSSSEKGTGDKELHAAVELIHYMHTYCLPPRKLPPMYPGEGKHQPFHSPSKRAKPDPPLQQPRLCGNDNCPSSPWHFSMHCKQSRTPLSEFSILKELLARELPCDVSKPYRLAKPVYASLARSQLHKSSRTSPPNTGREFMDGYNKPSTKIIPEMKTELRQILKVEPEAEKETAEEDGAKQGTPMGQGSYGKSSRKPDTSIYAVRRSKRLNPELSLWQSFLDKPPSEPTVSSATTANAFASIEPALCSSLQNFDTEAPAAEVEVSGADEMDGGFQNFPMELQTPSPESSRESDTYTANESQCFTSCHQTETPRCLSLPLAQTESTLGKRSFDQVLTVELCGTAGLTPPTTPPYKPSEEDLYKPDIHQRPAQKTAVITSSEPQPMISHRPISRKHQKKQPVRTELYAHLSRSAIRPAHSEQHGVLKRPFSRSFGDHDYCQVLKPEYSFQRKVLRSWEPLSHIETQHKRQVPDVLYQEESNKSFDKISVKEGSKQLRDQEIRASLTKHFGLLDSALDDGEEALFFKTPEYDTVFEDSCSEIGSPLEEEEEEEEEEEYYMSPLGSNRCLHSSALSRTNLHYCSRNRSDSESSCCRSRSPVNQQVFRRENGKRCQEGNMTSQRLMEKKREKAIGEGRVVYIQNLASSMSSSELKKQFEVFGEIVECCILTKNKRGDKYGVITYRCSEHAALSLKNGASLWKINEPLFQLAYGGFGHFFWTRFTDLADSNTEESSPTPVKSKYETMDFDSLLQEAQESLHR
ncbi:peroxisome proliferator-activated receptor gamma coactivator 1-beta isoform X1 [Pantherophis guttatus]|uniref:Peroxisome proliferator-activated receptor gamma coactivator 1-beta isoform X1 n=1 Tax=Pantherophis guttatus TaxID=94885 RepID=A0A6P9AWK8_PANGU|nr:peroxisome proliferator-activated receptor gamma coactivator 1-beta isoform X1 [Pantherophis guttatus]